jgi:hypothetical protein
LPTSHQDNARGTKKQAMMDIRYKRCRQTVASGGELPGWVGALIGRFQQSSI